VSTITVFLVQTDGTEQALQARVGQSLMQAAVDVEADGIAADCGGLLSCATCHVMFDADAAARLPAPSEDELSMLEMTAAAREPHSRLSCQITLTPALDGLRARVPSTQY
jgi:ferredoxin, 2Fe-2S